MIPKKRTSEPAEVEEVNPESEGDGEVAENQVPEAAISSTQPEKKHSKKSKLSAEAKTARQEKKKSKNHQKNAG